MKRTLLAVSVAVLISMMLVPRGHVDVLRYGHAREGNIREFLPFWLQSAWPQNEIMSQTFIFQTIFLAILAALIVNIRWQRKPKRPPS